MNFLLQLTKTVAINENERVNKKPPLRRGIGGFQRQFLLSLFAIG